MGSRLLAVGLDGFDLRIGAPLMRAGLLPNLSQVSARSARFHLHRPTAVRPGLIWEYFAAASTPQSSGRWTPICFDPLTYDIWQDGATQTPFAAALASSVVIFDVPFFDFELAPAVRGLVGWGVHSPGAHATARPAILREELAARFGSNAARPFFHGIPWPSIDVTREMSIVLSRSLLARGKAAAWLLGERLTDWDLAIVVAGELHGASEGMWHGVDVRHPLHGKAASTQVAREGLVRLYRAVDAMIGELLGRFPDDRMVVFALEGMGANESDSAGMALLPEILYRHAFGRPLMRSTSEIGTPAELPMLAEGMGWAQAVSDLLPPKPEIVRPAPDREKWRASLDWMPVAAYRPFWPQMQAFGLPSYDEGRVRLNVAGREARGLVAADGYVAARDQIEALLRGCVDPVSGKPAVGAVEKPDVADPRDIAPTQADLTVFWNGGVAGLDHPRHGRIGPLPYRRTGGHSGGHGFAWIAGAGLEPGNRGARLYCDLAPTLIHLLGEPIPPGTAGRSLIAS